MNLNDSSFTDFLEFFIGILGTKYKYYEAKQELGFICPFPNCDSSFKAKEKLWLNLEKQVYHCWVCGAEGKLQKLVEQFGSVHDRQKFLDLIEKYNVSFWNSSKNKLIKRNIIQLPPKFKFILNYLNHPDARNSLNFIQQNWHGTPEDITKFKIGFCDSGQYAGRIIFPFFDEFGNLTYFTSRAIYEQEPKYWNPGLNKDIIPNDYLIDWQSSIVLVEGPGDMLNAENSIPLLGSSLSEQSALFHKIVVSGVNLFLALDPDARKKSLKIAQKILEYGRNQIYWIEIPQNEDVGSLGKEKFYKHKMQAKKIDLNWILYENLNFW